MNGTGSKLLWWILSLQGGVIVSAIGLAFTVLVRADERLESNLSSRIEREISIHAARPHSSSVTAREYRALIKRLERIETKIDRLER